MTKRIVPTQVLTILPSLASRLLAQLPFDRSKETENSLEVRVLDPARAEVSVVR